MEAQPSPPQEMSWGWREVVCTIFFIGGLFASLFVLDLGAGSYDGFSLLWVVGMLILVMGLSEMTHSVLMRSFEARLRRRPEGHGFTARQYAVLGSVPALIALAAGAAFIAITPMSAAPGAYLLLVYGLVRLESLWLALIALRQPEGILFEERADGTHVHRPATREA